MISIFKPKKRIISLFQGGVDIHNHILPGIDDGAKNLQDTVDLLAKYDEHQIHRIIATPHIMSAYYPNTPLTIKNALAQVHELIEDRGYGHMDISAAAEYMIDNEFESILEEQQVLTLFQNYVLVELSYANPPLQLFEDLYRLTYQGYTPVLAHPERYLYFQNNDGVYKKLKTQGCLFQLNALSLTPFYGKEVQKNALELLAKGAIDLIATDLHHRAQFKLLETVGISYRTYESLKVISQQTRSLFE